MLQICFNRRLKDFQLAIDFHSLHDSSTLALFGPSGTGKSLTLQVIAGLVQPDSGHIQVNSQVLYDSSQSVAVPARLRRIGYVPQNYTLFPHLSVKQNILYGIQNLPKLVQIERLAYLLKILRLENLEERRPAQLSGGQQQRVALARALITEPQLLLLDEPFAALDSIIRGRLQEELLSLQERLALPIIMVTHDLNEAYTLAAQIVVIEAGQVIQSAERDDILFRPATEAVARFTLTRNIFRGEIIAIEEASLKVSSNGVEIVMPRPTEAWQVGETLTFCIRPERILFTVPGRSRDRGIEGNYLSATLKREIAHGTSFTLYLDLVTPLQKTTRDTSYDLQVEVSSEVYRRIDIKNQKEWLVALPKEQIHLITKKSH